MRDTILDEATNCDFVLKGRGFTRAVSAANQYRLIGCGKTWPRACFWVAQRFSAAVTAFVLTSALAAEASRTQLQPASDERERPTTDDQRLSMSAPTIVEVQGRKLKLTNLDKVLYPATGFTKGQVADYYVRIAPYLVPHLPGRALTMNRYPAPIYQQHSLPKNAPLH